MDYIDLPDWLQRLWEIKPELARQAEKYIDELKGAKNTEQANQPENGQQVCTNKSCAGYSNGYCTSFENCPVKAVSG